MAVKRSSREDGGTFAQLYDVQEQKNKRSVKPLGRPPKKVQRKPTTIHLTPHENRNLSRLHLLINDHFTINRSEIAGVAIDLMVALFEKKGETILEDLNSGDIEALKQRIFNFIKL
jgi:hypothetical protein